ncbi:MAG TPA: agmatine deiminase family protein [Candidatus Binatia bacterium]|nr:agmatine deiminase family protein [Candidatus Binatia bacterium]
MAKTNVSRATPQSLGYSMPAEWMPHRATWLSWPHNRETWPTQLERVREVWVRMMQVLSLNEQVVLLVNDEQTRQDVSFRLKSVGAVMENISILKIPTVDVWIRDYGPTFLTRAAGESPLAFNDWVFNGWGGKYPSYEDDDRVANEVASLLQVPSFDHSVVLEGGSIEVNGAGTCLTTEECLLNRNRNPHLSRGEIEQFLKDALGVGHVVWLGKGIVGDDTDGHIDDIARFVNPITVVCVLEANSRDENYTLLRENYERLLAARDQDGHTFSVVTLPCPAPVRYEGPRLPASYANFYIANEVVLVPVFDDPNDRKALGILQELFPERRVVGLPCADVVVGLGAIHCVTQQEPSVSERGP